ncbi:Pcc1-domain-containing protein [Massarina eburnea CBS 473.64]|uniref:Pcc1-domain-containing protein n=1 Tax=Massarina eburnea CBS 473.64 TaxID=1395130 RepID=A0A6A6SA62_9PLEO|nr:Pcc1-domain-containing protein [Massarina eburnea CBS 473.64]
MTGQMVGEEGDKFPCKLTLNIPFPTPHLATTALRALSVDQEPSPLVKRSFALAAPSSTSASSEPPSNEAEKTILRVEYAADTNRMLRVAVNGFLESVGVVVGVMKELDVDVVGDEIEGGLEGVQGLEVKG